MERTVRWALLSAGLADEHPHGAWYQHLTLHLQASARNRHHRGADHGQPRRAARPRWLVCQLADGEHALTQLPGPPSRRRHQNRWPMAMVAVL
jgi:hypothetical protein